ncbi:Oleate-induced peroxisomal protein [Scheffersomyces spartinae]|uniref:Oleate-induced peroxisomal protein POX18 n=1 Tax=Scheffersomyces spartinae TaxID=45513 RepID=A0A9P8AJP0_9ASCO|nr:Oleate-induced peroxisomal protein [Scheffersomyces spartinae]KAG7194312.1 Oleate-induced peroxisomal protein [Scheffersomyces spartinae]
MSGVVADGFNSSPMWEMIENGLQQPDLKEKAIKSVGAILVITLKNKDGKEQSWVMDLKDKGTVAKVDTPPKNDVQLILKDADFVKMAENKANGQKLFMSGKLKIKGNMMKAASLETVFKQLDPRAKL